MTTDAEGKGIASVGWRALQAYRYMALFTSDNENLRSAAVALD
jgi:hypothetical protein